MKVLLAPVGSRGDVQPQMVLAEELERRGHDVVFATCPNFRGQLQARGFETVAIGNDSDLVLRQNADLAEQNPLLALPRQLKLIADETHRQCTELLDADLPRFDVVVGAGLSFAAHLLAERQRAKYTFICYTLSGMQSAMHPPAALPLFWLPRWGNRVLWGAVRAGFGFSVGAVLGKIRQRYGLPADRDPWQTVHFSNSILAQDEALGSLPDDLPGPAVQVPALVRSTESEVLPADVEHFLQRRSSERLIYVGFGSMPTVQRARVIDAVSAFCNAHSARALLFSSHNEDESFTLPDTVLRVGSVDHARLFPRVDLVVHHGGAGTMAAALRAGVPQMIVPHILDQFFHARRLQQLGVGSAPVDKRTLGRRLLAVSWPAIAEQRRHAEELAKTLMPSGAPAAADHLEALARGAASTRR